MKILHTSDWHLGKKIGTISRIEEQRVVLDEICTIADKENVDAIVVAGDLFDTFNPPTEAIELLYATLKKLTNKGTRPVIAIAGNHDSPDRIEAPNPLARDNGILLIGYPKTTYTIGKTDLPFTISKTDESFVEITLQSKEKLRIITAAFANEIRLQEVFDSRNKDIDLIGFVTDFWAGIADKYCDKKGTNIFVGHHLFLPQNGEKLEEPEDEKPIQAISALLPFSCIPKQIDYVALGHLHRNQQIHKNPAIVYSGSPIAYSFSEASQKKYVSIFERNNNTNTVSHTELTTSLPLYKKKFNAIEDAVLWLTENSNCYVELTISSNTYLNPQQLKTLHDAHSGIITIIPEILIENSSIKPIQQASSQEATIEELFEEYFVSKHGQKPNDELKVLFQRILATEI